MTDAAPRQSVDHGRPMFLIQIVLPLYDNAGRAFAHELFTRTVAELTDRFGGATAFTRNPAEGFWEDPGGGLTRDDVIVVEVMIPDLDAALWRNYRRELESRFRQETILIRALPCRVI